jgi:hypothetical protein
VAVDNAAALRQAQADCCRILVLVHVVQLDKSQAGVDAIVAAAAGTSQLVPKPDYSLDGESYQWNAYRKSLEESIETLQKLIIMLEGPFEVRSRAT